MSTSRFYARHNTRKAFNLEKKEYIYPYAPQFQTRILATCLRYPSFLRIHRSVIRAEYFSSQEHRLLAGKLLDFYDDNRHSADTVAPQTLLATACRATPDEDMRAALGIVVEHIEALVELDDCAVGEEIVQFARHAEAKREIRNAVEALSNDEDIEDIVTKLQDTFDLGKDLASTGTHLPDEFEELIRAWGQRRDNLISTGFSSFDKMLGGGLGPGELGIIAGLPKSFKSGTLVNIAYGAMSLPHRTTVVYFTLELSEVQVGFRAAKRISLQTDSDAKEDEHRFLMRLQREQSSRLGGQLFVKEYPLRTATTKDFESYLTYLVGKGVKPGLIVVDYGGIMADTDKDKLVSARNKFSSLKAMGQKWKLPVWTAHRLNRDAYNSVKTSGANVADNIEIAADCDFMGAIEQTDEERDQNYLRIRGLFTRNEEQDTQVGFRWDPAKMAMKDIGFHLAEPDEEDTPRGKRKKRKKTDAASLSDALQDIARMPPADIFETEEEYDAASKEAADEWDELSK